MFYVSMYIWQDGWLLCTDRSPPPCLHFLSCQLETLLDLSSLQNSGWWDGRCLEHGHSLCCMKREWWRGLTTQGPLRLSLKFQRPKSSPMATPYFEEAGKGVFTMSRKRKNWKELENSLVSATVTDLLFSHSTCFVCELILSAWARRHL